MQDLKHYGLRKAEARLDDLAAGVSWIVAVLVLVLYVLGATP